MVLPTQLEPWRAKKVWLNYILYQKDGKLKKPPVNPYTLGNGSSTEPASWATFDEANDNIGKSATVKISDDTFITQPVAGVGISLEAAGLTGVDYDHVIERDEAGTITAVSDEARKIWRYLDSYAEISVSGTGVHTLVKAKNPNQELNKNGLPKGYKVKNADGSDYELYDNGRYFTVTGNALKGCKGIEERQEQVNRIVKDIFEARRSSSSSVDSCGNSGGSGERVIVSEGDGELWAKMFASAKGAEIKRLYDGDYSDFSAYTAKGYKPDRSRADLAIINHLFYWTNGDEARVERMYFQTKLDHSKWSHESYRETTLSSARATFKPYNGYTAAEKKAYAKKKEAEERAADADLDDLADTLDALL